MQAMRQSGDQLAVRSSNAGWFAAVVLAALTAAAIVYSSHLTLALVAVVAAGGIAVMWSRPEMTTLVVVFALYSNLAVVAIRFFNVPEPAAVGFFVLLAIPLGRYVVFGHEPVILTPVLYLMLFYLALQLLSAAFSQQPAESLQKMTRYVVEGILLYFLVLNTVRSRDMLRRVLWTMVLAGAFMGSLSVYQAVTKSYQNSLGGLAQVADPDEIGDHARQAGPIGEKNRYAQIMIVLLPLGVFLYRFEKTVWVRRAAAACCAPILAGTLLTYSRGAGVAVGLLLMALVVLRVLRLKQVMGYAAAALLVTLLIVPGYVQRFTSLAGLTEVEAGSRGNADTSLRGRATEMLASLRIFLDHPLLGVGPGQTPLYIAEYGNRDGFRRLQGNWRGHNLYLEELADTGLIGFAGLAAILAFTLHQLWRLRQRATILAPDAELATGLLLAVLAYLFTAMFLHLSYQRYFWLLMTVAGIGIRVLRPESPSASPAEQPLPARG